jgi:hypothetical protein
LRRVRLVSMGTLTLTDHIYRYTAPPLMRGVKREKTGHDKPKCELSEFSPLS